jgi:hypothetical protein
MNDSVQTPSGRVVPMYLLFAYVDSLKEALLLRRRRYRPGLLLTNEFDEMMKRTALVLIDHNCDPFRYVNYVFNLFIDKHDDVYPTMLCSAWAINKFLEANLNFEHQLELSVKLMADHVKIRMERGDTFDEIVTDEHAPLTALFRFALAHSEKRADLAERFKKAAEEQLFFEPLYRKFLGQWLPEGFGNG